MPEVRHSTTVARPIADVWAFVEQMDNWAPLLTGYQSHEKESDTRSIWTVKGDVGILARTVKLQVDITEWSGPDRVRFTLLGLGEAVDGEGTFELRAVAPRIAPLSRSDPSGQKLGSFRLATPRIAPTSQSDPSGQKLGSFRLADAEATAEAEPPAPPQRAGVFARLLRWLFGAIFRSVHGTVERKELEAPAAASSILEFHLRMDAGGPMAPMVNAMLEPALLPAATDLAERIAAALEEG